MIFSKLEKYCNKKNINFLYKDKVSSTMNIAKDLKFLDKKNLLMITNEQTYGKGRSGNLWISKKGNIFFTLKIYFNTKNIKYHEIGLLSCIEIKKTMKKFNIHNVKLKWPNDIFIDTCKVGGIIVEVHEYEKNIFCLLGVGLNFISSPKITDYKTTFLKKYNSNIDREIFIKTFLDNFFISLEIWNKNNKLKFLKYYKNSLMYLGKSVIINYQQNKLLKGVFLDVTKDGYVLLDSNNKNIIVTSGSMELYS